ncbi:branched-chain amino acid ABC transporter permease [Desulfosoma sp.]|uniref:branched-chain amino acid ABC transporter permease n=1 Tax=Desulfosoma sp. TaxID=2603217 RepID=UPI00404B695E
MQDFLLHGTNGLLLGVIYALSALGVSLIVGIMNVINFSHGELYVLAGYFSALFARALGLPVALAALLAVAGVFVFGLVVERTLIRNTYGNDMASLIIAFVLSIVLQNAYLFIFGPYPQKPPNWVSGSTHLLGLFYYGNQRLAALGAGAAVIVLLFVAIKKTWCGKTVRSVAQDREMAAMLGVNPTLVNMLSLVRAALWPPPPVLFFRPFFPSHPL